MRHSRDTARLTRSSKSLLKALGAAAITFLLLFVFFRAGAASYSSHLSQKQTSAFQAGIAKDKAYLQEQGDALAKDSSLVARLLSGDREGLLAITNKEKDLRSIGFITVADKDGMVMTRTIAPGMYGDNLFLTLAVGRAVAQGKSVQSAELSSDGRPILATGRPILHDGSIAGGLFASYLMDDAYASRFKDTYLSDGTQVAFYTKENGVYGDSFPDEGTRALIQSYFNTGSEWVVNGSSGRIISFPDGTSYIVMNIVFPGLEQSPGGALLFVPRIDLTPFANAITALLVVCAFLFFALRGHLRTRGEERGWRYYLMLLGALLVVYGLAYAALYSQSLGRLQLRRIPYPLYNSTIRLQPDHGFYGVGFEQRFSIIVDTGDEDINAIQVGLHFDPSIVEMRSLDIASSTCSYAIESTVNEAAGTAQMSCILVNKGVDQHSYTIADAVLVPKRVGVFGISFDSVKTEVLANDGLGTNVLRASQDAIYTAEDFQLLWQNAGAPQPLMVFSPTHSNEARWYNARTARFVWLGEPDTVYDYAFDTSPDTIPTAEHTIQGTTVDVPVPGDGVYYFHLRLASGGPVANFRINADMTPPVIIAMKLSQDSINAGDVVRVSFKAEDPTSGIQRNYYVDLGNHLFLPVGPQLYIPFPEAGDQKITLRVYDGAGNYAEKTQIVHVQNN